MADSVGTESARHVRQVDAQRVASQTPLDLLAEFGCLEAMEALVKETLPSQEKLADALRMASAHGQMESIRALLGLGANPVISGSPGYNLNALFAARSLPVLAMLCDAIPTPLKRGVLAALQRCFLHNAFLGRPAHLVELMGRFGPSLLDRDGFDALHETLCSRERSEICEYTMRTLFQLGASPNASSSPDGETILMLACQKQNSMAVDLLLQHNANVNPRDVRGSPLSSALSGFLRPLRRPSLHNLNTLLLMGAEDKSNRLLYMCQRASEMVSHEPLTMLLARNADPNACDVCTGTSAIMAVLDQSTDTDAAGVPEDCYTTLLRAGANLLFTRGDGQDVVGLLGYKFPRRPWNGSMETVTAHYREQYNVVREFVKDVLLDVLANIVLSYLATPR